MFRRFIKNPPTPEPMHPERMRAKIQGMKNEGIYYLQTLTGHIHVDEVQRRCELNWKEYEKNQSAKDDKP